MCSKREPLLRSVRRFTVTYAAPADGSGPVNVVKPIYHVAWLASRLGLAVFVRLRYGAALLG